MTWPRAWPTVLDVAAGIACAACAALFLIAMCCL